MKKLSLYIFLVLMVCNVGFAESYNCKMVGQQNLPSEEDILHYSTGEFKKTVIQFPKKLNLKLNFTLLGAWYGKGQFYDTNAYFNNSKFTFRKYGGFYSVSNKDIKFYIPSLDTDESAHTVKFMFDFNIVNNTYDDLWVDHFWWGGSGVLDDYDAHYQCKGIK